MNVSELVLDYLSLKGVDTAFCITGGASAFLNDALSKSNFRVIHNYHEQSCAMAADGYARIAKKPALVLCTNGPGATNLLTGVMGAFQDSIPMFVVTGQVPQKASLHATKHELRQVGVQEVNTENFANAAVKYFGRITNVNSALEVLENAYHEMITGRPGPVWIEVPLDLQNQTIDTSAVKPILAKSGEIRVDDHQSPLVQKIMGALAESLRPLVIVGNGIHLASAEQNLQQFANMFEFPFVSTWLASDLFDCTHSKYIGNFGILGQRAANIAVQNADVVLVLGSRLSLPCIGYETTKFASNAQIFYVDIDGNEIVKETINVTLGLNLCVKRFLEMANTKKIVARPEQKLWFDSLREIKDLLSIQKEIYLNEQEFIDSYAFIDLLSDCIRKDDIYVTDMGTSFTCTMQSLRNSGQNRLITSSGLSAMGFGLPGAIGARLASSGRVVCIAGDGGLQMSIQELQTIVQYNLDIKLFVLDSNGYLAISIMQENSFEGRFFGSNPKSGVSSPDFVKIAAAYGIKGSVLPTELKGAKEEIQAVLNHEGPHVCLVPISPNQKMRPRVQSQRDENGAFVSPSLDNMWPPLSLERENYLNETLGQLPTRDA